VGFVISISRKLLVAHPSVILTCMFHHQEHEHNDGKRTNRSFSGAFHRTQKLKTPGGVMRESRQLRDDIRNIEKFMEIPILKEVEVDNLRALLRISKVREYTKGEQIIREGANDPLMYILYHGQVRVVKKNKVVAVLRRCGDVFGEMGSLGGTGRTASVFADEDSACLTVDAAGFEQLSGNDRLAFGFMLYRLLAEVLTQRLQQTTDKLTRAGDEILRLKARIRELSPDEA
jgi:CRP-like cAMP-binding protein